MAFFVGSSPLPQPSQIFTVGSISWVINADGVGELLEPEQIGSAPATPTPATTDPISEAIPRSLSATTCRPLPRYQRRPINNDDLIESIDRVGLKLTDCLSDAESALDTLVQRRPPSDLDLSEGAWETARAMALPFGFSNTAAAYQHALRGKLADQIADQLSPTVNMLHASQGPGASFQTILDENPDSES